MNSVAKSIILGVVVLLFVFVTPAVGDNIQPAQGPAQARKPAQKAPAQKAPAQKAVQKGGPAQKAGRAGRSGCRRIFGRLRCR